MIYSFFSSGPKGTIHKVARFSALAENVYNFGFGDYEPATGKTSDVVNSNNGDAAKIMGTLGSIIYDFTNVFSEAAIFVHGTSAAKTRFYQFSINKHWEEINPIFEVIGLKNDKWESFEKVINYQAFIERRKDDFLLK